MSPRKGTQQPIRWFEPGIAQFPEIEESVRVFNTGFLGSKTTNYLPDSYQHKFSFVLCRLNILSRFPCKVFTRDGGDRAQKSKPNAIELSQSLAASLFESMRTLSANW